MTPNSKWILTASADDPVRDVAVRTIEVRLAAVRHHLPLAAEKAHENVEHVHQLRVATRRSVAALEMYRKLFPKEPRKALASELKAVRRAAGRARDYDVLLERQTQHSEDPLARQFLKEVRERRSAAQIPLREIHASLAKTQQLDLLAQQMYAAAANESPLFGPWARKQLRKSVKAFFASEPSHLNDLEALHAFRIRGKELRYAMEL
ncbi:MAG: CHAD domain-containing protein, partial [Pirellulaceae bacterium]